MSLTCLPLEEGLAFDTGPESVYAVQDYALSTNKSVRVVRASGSDRRLVCTSEQPCGFFVQIYRQRMSNKKTYGKWYIASMELAHSETCDSQPRLTTRQMAELPAFLTALQTNPKSSIESLIAVVLEQHGVSLDKQIRLVYRARDMVRNGKVMVRSNILPSLEAPLPPRQFVRRHAREKKEPIDGDKAKIVDRMVWTDILVESLLSMRLHKYGAQFVEAGEQSQQRELWGIIQKEFNEKNSATVTVTQMRAKFRYLRDQYLRVRAEEEEAARDADKLVIYPRYWDLLAEYYGTFAQGSRPSAGGYYEENAEAATSQPTQSASVESPAMISAPVQLVPLQSGATQAVPMDSTAMQLVPAQYFPLQPDPAFSPLQEHTSATASPARAHAAQKRRRLNSTETSLAASSHPSAPSVDSDLTEKLEAIQNAQSEMARSIDGIKHVVKQSTEAIRGLQQALNQSNQVNAALLDFLRNQSSADF